MSVSREDATVRIIVVAGPNQPADQLVETLADRGVDVRRAEDTRVGLREVEDGNPDCVVVAATLPDGDGVEFIERARANRPDLAAVLLLDPDDAEPVNRAEGLAAALALDPDRINQVVDRVVSVLRERQLEDDRRRSRSLTAAIVEVLEMAAAAGDPQAIEDAVPDRLAFTDAFTAVWVSQYDPERDLFEPTTAAGIDAGALRSIPAEELGGGLADPTAAVVRAAADPRRLTIVLRNGETVHGAIHGYVVEGTLTDSERRLLGGLGRSLGRLLSVAADDGALTRSAAPAATEVPSTSGESDPATETGRPSFEVYAEVVAHELRNHLNVARSYLGTGPDPDDGDRERVAAALDRIEGIVDEAAAVAGREVDPASLRTVDLGGLAEDVWDQVGIEQAELVLDDPGHVRADPDLLELLLENLFRNSTGHAGPAVTVTVGRTADGFYVADDGPGVPPADRERIFEWGYAAEASTTGVGLAIADRIADAHDWSMRATDSAEGGARFEVSGVERSS